MNYCTYLNEKKSHMYALIVISVCVLMQLSSSLWKTLRYLKLFSMSLFCSFESLYVLLLVCVINDCNFRFRSFQDIKVISVFFKMFFVLAKQKVYDHNLRWRPFLASTVVTTPAALMCLSTGGSFKSLLKQY